MTEISVLIVTRNRPDDLRRCLRSVFDDPTGKEVVVVDNGSTLPQVGEVLAAFPDVKLLRLSRNYGDWPARDLGRHKCESPLILSLDDDAELMAGALGRLLEYAKAFPNAAVVQPAVIEPTRFPGRILGALHDPKVPHLLAGFLGGACVYRAQALGEAGGFPHFWLGGAEPYLTLRFLDLGYDIVYAPDATIIHWASPAGRIVWNRLYYISAGRLRAVLRNEPRLGVRLLHVLWKPPALAGACIRRGLILPALFLPVALFFLGLMELRKRPVGSVHAFRKLAALRHTMHPVTAPPSRSAETVGIESRVTDCGSESQIG